MVSLSFRVALITLMVWLACPPHLLRATESTNLIPNPGFHLATDPPGLPEGWQRHFRAIPGVEPSRVYLCQVSGHPSKFLAIEGGPDRQGRVWCQLTNIRPHTDYLLEFTAYRPQFTNGVYLEVEIFGQRHLINQHFSYGGVQSIFLRINSGATRGPACFMVANPHRDVLAFGAPSLREARRRQTTVWRPPSAIRAPRLFPVGIFAAKPEDLPDISAAGFNAVQGYEAKPETVRSMAEISARLGLQYLPHYPAYVADLSRDLGDNPALLGFYIEDEPEGRSVPPEKLQALKDRLKKDHPEAVTAVAMLRPQMIEVYQEAADIFLVDPYPVPHMPMTWLADSLDAAARQVSPKRLWAVIQAFGGEKWAQSGWPQRPTHLEMRCLTYLALVHQAHGLFYFSYPEVRSDPTSWSGLGKIVSELRQLQSWLLVPNQPTKLRVEMTSPFKTDAAGRPAVHYCLKSRGREHLLIMVNAIDRPVSFYLHGFGPRVPWLTEMFQQRQSVVQDGNIRDGLGAYEARIYCYTRDD